MRALRHTVRQLVRVLLRRRRRGRAQPVGTRERGFEHRSEQLGTFRRGRVARNHQLRLQRRLREGEPRVNEGQRIGESEEEKSNLALEKEQV
jgi:hypothetical protein